MFPKNAPSGASLALALVAILCAPLPARAADRTVLRPLIDVEQGWDSNIFNRSSGEEGSLVTRVGPALWLENTGELGHARLGVNANGRSIWSESDLSGIDSGVRGDFERRLTPRFTVFGDGLLQYLSGYQQINDQTTVLLSEQPAWKNDRLGAGFRYMLTARLALLLSGSAARVNYERVDPIAFTPGGVPVGNSTGNYRDRTILDARASLTYQLTLLDALSLTVDTNDTSYQDLGTGTNDSTIWNTKVGWTRNWSPLWLTAATIGIRAIDSTQDDVPQAAYYCGNFFCDFGGASALPEQTSLSSTGTSMIGSLSIQRTFARSLLRLSYDRDTRSTGGASRVNYDIDAFRLLLTHQLAERVKLSLVGDYSMLTSVSDKLSNSAPRSDGSCPLGGSLTQITDPSWPFPVLQCAGGSSEETREYTSLLARIDWQLRRQLSAYAVARYYQTTTDQAVGSGIDIQTEKLDKFTFGIGFRYAWDLGL